VNKPEIFTNILKLSQASKNLPRVYIWRFLFYAIGNGICSYSNSIKGRTFADTAVGDNNVK
jgi:hypothetical protein